MKERDSTSMTGAAGKGLRIAVVGGGVAGIVAAWLLQKEHRVTLLEANDYLGGHTHTIVIEEGPDTGTPVDTGFIVLNDRTYPLFRSFLENMGVPTRFTNMSFSFHDKVKGLTYSGSGLNGLFSQRRNLMRPSFWRMLGGMVRFFRESEEALEKSAVPEVSLGEYLLGYPRETIEDYILPMAAAIWSAAPGEVESFPAESFLRFFHNHGLLGIRDRPQWMTVAGGSHSYVKTFSNSFSGEIRLSQPVSGISRSGAGVNVRLDSGESLPFDRVVVAVHADEALKVLEDPSSDEDRLLGAWRYQPNKTVLHTDTTVLPPLKRAWSCWNYCREGSGDETLPVSVSYSMNLLQGLTTKRHYCVSLNRRTPVRADSIITSMLYRHPIYDFNSLRAQGELPSLNGRQNTWFCGSYFGYGFHEDAVRSAVQVGRDFGVKL
jgi:predicted NAD/FAD-binding protein